MKIFKFVAVCLTAFLFIGCGGNKNQISNYSIQKAMQSDLAKETLDPNIQVLFAQGSGKVIKKDLVANKKTNSVGKDNEEACQRAFLSAVITFQNRAKSEGATKVINLHSYYKKNEFASKTEYQCANGAIMAGVALKGDIAK